MKYFIILLLPISLICLWIQNGYTDRLYTWTDDKGVTHISKNPPPPNATLKDIMDYTSHPEERNQAVKVPEKKPKKPKKTEPDRIKAETGEGLEPEIYYDDDSDPDYYKRKKRRKERLENGKPDETPEKVKHENRSHKSRR